MPRNSRFSAKFQGLAVPLAGLALIGGGLPSSAWAAPPSGWIEPPPAVVISATQRTQTDLEILQAAIEAYRGQHFFKYPEASSLPELVRLLSARRLLPTGYKPSFTVAEFRADRKGYKISAQTEGEVLTIETPERFDPFWSFLW
ncbi:hypothetical protein J7643_10420 [bacterium]|nr:hypothetical protein [bacterium]